MADRAPTPPSAPRKTRTGRWVWITVFVITVLQVGPSLFIIFQRGIAGRFDWPGYIAYHLGSMAVPLAVGCVGLLFKRNRGFGFFVVSLGVFLFATFGTLTAP